VFSVKDMLPKREFVDQHYHLLYFVSAFTCGLTTLLWLMLLFREVRAAPHPHSPGRCVPAASIQ
jgi:hypothetical protein